MKNKKHPVSSSVGKNALLMRGIRGEGPDCSKLTVTVMQITTHYSGVQKSISEHTTRQTSKWIGYSSGRPIKKKSNKVLSDCICVYVCMFLSVQFIL